MIAARDMPRLLFLRLFAIRYGRHEAPIFRHIILILPIAIRLFRAARAALRRVARTRHMSRATYERVAASRRARQVRCAHGERRAPRRALHCYAFDPVFCLSFHDAAGTNIYATTIHATDGTVNRHNNIRLPPDFFSPL